MLHRYQPDTVKLEAGREFHGMTLLELAKDILSARRQTQRAACRSIRCSRTGLPGNNRFPRNSSRTSRIKRCVWATTPNPQTFAPFTKRGTIADFKPVSRTQIGDVPSLTLVNPSGEIHYTKVTDAKETIFARNLRQDLRR